MTELWSDLQSSIDKAGSNIPEGEWTAHAAVSLVLRQNAESEPEILFIKRSEKENDPWSGQMAYPGGRADEEDADFLATAMRECLEEVGVDLASSADYLGPLDVIQSRKHGMLLPSLIHPYVFALNTEVEFSLQSVEVDGVFWKNLKDIFHEDCIVEYHLKRSSMSISLPALQVAEQKVWGLTYMMLTDFFKSSERNSLGKKGTGKNRCQ